jgi:pyrimidine-nucleoside phosphorylase
MTVDETTALTLAMARSGTMLKFDDEAQIVVDKHSTGGVGDKTSLVLVPLLACFPQLRVPKLSGRGLVHTGGTLDKLEAIPGLRVDLTADEFRRQVIRCGLAIASPTTDIVPADAVLYGLRNETGTVDSVHLGTASVMSKKIAGGAEFIVLDVKCGNGAFMQTLERAREIAAMMVAVGKKLGKQVKAVISSMDQPLGHAIGNCLELKEALEVLRGHGPPDLKELCLQLGAVTLVSVGLAAKDAEARGKLNDHLSSGRALAMFRVMAAAQLGDVSTIDDPNRLPWSNTYATSAWGPDQDGLWVAGIDTLKLGLVAKELAGSEPNSNGQKANGLIFRPKIGDRVAMGCSIASAHGNRVEDCLHALSQVSAAITLSREPVTAPSLIIEVL